MSTSTTTQMRKWTGPAVFSFGFRPLFLLACVWAAVAMILWIGMLSGRVALPTAFDPVTWHAHEFLFGYLSAAMAGFLLTAVPNWTGRLPVVGWPLVGLCALWIVGRLAIGASAYLPTALVTVADLSFLAALWGVILREIVAGKKWANLPVLIILGLFIAADALFHFEAIQSGTASQGYGLRLGLGMALVLIMLIGGKVTPSFTRNWLVKRGDTVLPTPPMQRYDKAVILVSAATLLAWVAQPDADVVGAALVVIAGLHIVRLSRWQGVRALAEPLVWVLHAGYAFVPLGALAVGVSILFPATISTAAALHVWTAGAIGLMTLGVMTRASLGHSGRALHAGAGTTCLYAAVIGAVITRLAADLFATYRVALLDVTALLWIAGFAGFVVLYAPLLLRPKPAR